MPDVDAYVSLPYTTVLKRDEDGDIVATIQELPGCIAHGSTDAEALAMLRDVQKAWIEEALERGVQIPRPRTDEELPSGKWVQRVPRSLHARLAALAQAEGTSLNQLVTAILSEAVPVKEMWSRTQQTPVSHPTIGEGWGDQVWFWSDQRVGSKRYAQTFRNVRAGLQDEEDDVHKRR
jgi:antitoxin HicB